MPDVLGGERARYAGKTVAVLGAGHSADRHADRPGAAQGRSAGDTRSSGCCAATSPEKAFGGGANDKLAARGALGAVLRRRSWPAAACASRPASGVTAHHRERRASCAIGAGSACCGRASRSTSWSSRPASAPIFDFLRELRLALDPALECPPTLAPLIDPNLHSCGTVRPHGARELAQPEPGFYFAGMKSYGRAPTFLMLTGYEQVRSIVAEHRRRPRGRRTRRAGAARDRCLQRDGFGSGERLLRWAAEIRCLGLLRD